MCSTLNMPAKRRKLIFELSQQEKEARFRRALSATFEKAKELNQPVVYRNELCVKPNLFIYQYPDGRTELIEQDSKNSKEKTLKVLHL